MESTCEELNLSVVKVSIPVVDVVGASYGKVRGDEEGSPVESGAIVWIGELKQSDAVVGVDTNVGMCLE